MSLKSRIQNRKASRNYDQFKVGDLVRVLTNPSEYFWLIGRVREVTEFHDSGMVEFTEQELGRSKRPEILLRASKTVHFYFRELQGVNQI